MSVRTIVLVSVDRGWNVIEGNRFCDRLTPDEALGMCARLLLNTQFPPYPMDTLAEHNEKAVQRAARTQEFERLMASTPSQPAAGMKEKPKMAKSKDKPKRDANKGRGKGKKS